MRSDRFGDERPGSLDEDFRSPRRSQSGQDFRARDAFDWRRDGSTQWHESGQAGLAKTGARYNGYEFRPDSTLSEPGSSQEGGWVFRPLNGREQERLVDDGLYPPLDERDYQQRGPWRSYEDEGTAFGYHTDSAGYAPGLGHEPYPTLQ